MTTIGGFFLCGYCGWVNSVPKTATPAERAAGVTCLRCAHVFHFAADGRT